MSGHQSFGDMSLETKLSPSALVTDVMQLTIKSIFGKSDPITATGSAGALIDANRHALMWTFANLRQSQLGFAENVSSGKHN